MADLWIYASTGLATDPPEHGQALPYPDDAEVTVLVWPLQDWVYDYCDVVRYTVPEPTMYRVTDNAVTVTLDVLTALTFVGHDVAEPPVPPATGLAPLLVPIGMSVLLFSVSRFL